MLKLKYHMHLTEICSLGTKLTCLTCVNFDKRIIKITKLFWVLDLVFPFVYLAVFTTIQSNIYIKK